VAYDDNYKAGSIVWRYMTLPKFLDLVQTSEQYFARLDKLDDPDEHALVTAACRRDVNHAETVYANCWFLSDEESATMWPKYAGETGVAVQSSKTRLVAALNNLMYYGSFHYTASGAVQYRTDLEMADFLRSTGGRIGNFVPAFNKRLTYCHEQEFRLAISLSGESRPETHVRLRADLHDLIERIYVSSRADASEQDVQEAVGRAGLTQTVRRSTLY
jgi:hypothetical protein